MSKVWGETVICRRNMKKGMKSKMGGERYKAAWKGELYKRPEGRRGQRVGQHA